MSALTASPLYPLRPRSFAIGSVGLFCDKAALVPPLLVDQCGRRCVLRPAGWSHLPIEHVKTLIIGRRPHGGFRHTGSLLLGRSHRVSLSQGAYEWLPGMASELVGLHVNVIGALGTRAAKVAKETTVKVSPEFWGASAPASACSAIPTPMKW
jgi:hypothetical protein